MRQFIAVTLTAASVAIAVSGAPAQDRPTPHLLKSINGSNGIGGGGGTSVGYLASGARRQVPRRHPADVAASPSSEALPAPVNGAVGSSQNLQKAKLVRSQVRRSDSPSMRLNGFLACPFGKSS